MTFSALILALAMAATGPAADIHVGVDTVDLGNSQQGESLNVEYLVENRGDAALSIEVKTSCACTVATSPESIAPGQTGVVSATIDTTRLSGEISRALTLTSNDADTPVLRLIATATIDPVSDTTVDAAD